MEEALLNPIQADPPSRYAIPLFELHKREAAAEAQVAAGYLKTSKLGTEKGGESKTRPPTPGARPSAYLGTADYVHHKG